MIRVGWASSFDAGRNRPETADNGRKGPHMMASERKLSWSAPGFRLAAGPGPSTGSALRVETGRPWT